MFFLPLELKTSSDKPRIPPANLIVIVTSFLLYFIGCCWPVSRYSGIGSILLYGFSHADLWHLVFNMWVLWIFGNAVNRRLGDGYYLLAYLGSILVVGIAAWLFCDWPVVGASGGVFAVATIAMLLMPSARLLIGYALWFPLTLLVGLIWRPRKYWLEWFLRGGVLELKMVWCLLLVPLLLVIDLLLLRLCWGVFAWGTAAHLQGVICGVAVVLMLPTRITMPGRFARGLAP